MLQTDLAEIVANIHTLLFKSAGHVIQIEEHVRLVRRFLVDTLTAVEIDGSLLDDNIDFVGEASEVHIVNELFFKVR